MNITEFEAGSKGKINSFRSKISRVPIINSTVKFEQMLPKLGKVVCSISKMSSDRVDIRELQRCV
jgi:hypothetical protein